CFDFFPCLYCFRLTFFFFYLFVCFVFGMHAVCVCAHMPMRGSVGAGNIRSCACAPGWTGDVCDIAVYSLPTFASSSFIYLVPGEKGAYVGVSPTGFYALTASLVPQSPNCNIKYVLTSNCVDVPLFSCYAGGIVNWDQVRNRMNQTQSAVT